MARPRAASAALGMAARAMSVPAAAEASGSTIIDAARARQLLEKEEAKFLDVRAPERYSEGHVPTAANVHTFFTYLASSDAGGVRELTDTFAEEMRGAGISGGDHVVAYEDSLQTLFGASCRALYLLKLLGHTRVSVLGSGYEGWVRDGHPTTTRVEQIVRGSFQPKWTPSIWRGKEEVLAALRDPNTVLLDVRDLEEWTGHSSSPYGVDFAPRKGRIPGATHILWTDFMEIDSEGVKFKTPEEIHAMCAAKGVTPDKEVIVYCFKGARASNTYLALQEAGFEKVSNYFASWNEWSRDKELEVDSTQL